jgi:two-component system response regulator AtoC
LPPSPQGQNHYAQQSAPPPQPPAVQQSAPPIAAPVSVMPETDSLKDIARNAALRAEREAISGMLARTNWNKRKAAARLQISYKALLYKIKDCGLTDPRITAGLPENLVPMTIIDGLGGV